MIEHLDDPRFEGFGRQAAPLGRYAVEAKEVWESFEVAARARSTVRRATVVDLCCGHGLAGLLIAAFDRTVENLWLVDERRPGNYERVVAAVADVAPWGPSKVRWLEAPLKRALPLLPAGAGILAVHACGVRSDRAVDADPRAAYFRQAKNGLFVRMALLKLALLEDA